jgi:hypothetical protein
MGQKIEINKANQTVLLFSSKKQEWEDKTMSISAIFRATYYGNVSGYDVYFKGGVPVNLFVMDKQ